MSSDVAQTTDAVKKRLRPYIVNSCTRATVDNCVLSALHKRIYLYIFFSYQIWIPIWENVHSKSCWDSLGPQLVFRLVSLPLSLGVFGFAKLCRVNAELNRCCISFGKRDISFAWGASRVAGVRVNSTLCGLCSATLSWWHFRAPLTPVSPPGVAFGSPELYFLWPLWHYTELDDWYFFKMFIHGYSEIYISWCLPFGNPKIQNYHVGQPEQRLPQSHDGWLWLYYIQ